jgi:hypothetical protein
MDSMNDHSISLSTDKGILADSDDLAKYESAKNILLNISAECTPSGIPSPESLRMFKTLTKTSELDMLVQVICNMETWIKVLETHIHTKKIIISRRENIKKKFNEILNKFLPLLSESSLLKGLMFLNKDIKMLKHHAPKVRDRSDILFGGQLQQPSSTGSPTGISSSVTATATASASVTVTASVSVTASASVSVTASDAPKFILRTKTVDGLGGRVNLSSSHEALSLARSYLEQTTWDDLTCLRVQQKLTGNNRFGRMNIHLREGIIYFLSLRFPLPGVDGKKYFVSSDDGGLRHILCNGNPPHKHNKLDETVPNFKTIYPYYAEFLVLVKQRINQIIRDSYDNPNCPFVHIGCCRIEPICGHEVLVMKPERSGTKLSTCHACRMDLCAGGCGRIYHGETQCDVSFDEASEALIGATSKPCPHCHINITKSEGCNHMRCTRCRTEFCFVCATAFPLDANGHPQITEHFSGNAFSVTGSRCNQFDHE